jgi:hypothetical protein
MHYLPQRRTVRWIQYRTGLALVVAAMAAACSGNSPTAPSPQPETTTTTSDTPSSGVVTRAATLQSANGYRTAGTAAILRDGSEFKLELHDDFRTSASSGLELRLCDHEACTGNVLQVGRILRSTGRQIYPLSHDGAAYGYVVIWCEVANLAFGFGALQ